MATPDDVTTAILLPELVARRHPGLDPNDRRNLQLRALTFGSVGLPAVVTAVDTVSQARTVERRRMESRPLASAPGGGEVVLERAERQLRAAVDAAEAEIARREETIKRVRAELKEAEDRLKAVRERAKRLDEAAQALVATDQA